MATTTGALRWRPPRARAALPTERAEPDAAARRVRLLKLGNFDEPTYLTAPRGDRRRFVVEREGRIGW